MLGGDSPRICRFEPLVKGIAKKMVEQRGRVLPLQQFANIFAREYRKVDLIVARFLDLCHPGIWIGCDADDLRKLHLRIQKNI